MLVTLYLRYHIILLDLLFPNKNDNWKSNRHITLYDVRRKWSKRSNRPQVSEKCLNWLSTRCFHSCEDQTRSNNWDGVWNDDQTLTFIMPIHHFSQSHSPNKRLYNDNPIQSSTFNQSIQSFTPPQIKYQTQMATLTNADPLVDQYEPEWAHEEMELHAWDNQDTGSMFCAIMWQSSLLKLWWPLQTLLHTLQLEIEHELLLPRVVF